MFLKGSMIVLLIGIGVCGDAPSARTEVSESHGTGSRESGGGKARATAKRCEEDPLLETLVALEMRYLEGMKRKDVPVLRRISAPDEFIIYRNGSIQSIEEFLGGVESWSVGIDSYKLLDPQVVMPSPDTGVITYRVTVNGQQNAIRASSVWARRWQILSYQETARPDSELQDAKQR